MRSCEWNCPLGVVVVVISLQLSPLRNYCPIAQLITGGSDGKWEQQTHMGGQHKGRGGDDHSGSRSDGSEEVVWMRPGPLAWSHGHCKIKGREHPVKKAYPLSIALRGLS